MRLGFAALLWASVAFAQPVDPCTVEPYKRLPRCRERFAFFEFAPSNGAGMTAPCACTTPTGAKGEALTFTRASSGTCLKSGTTTGIANGDLVTCATNEPRVMPGGDGTGGAGLLVEGTRTNIALRSEEFDNAAWTKTNCAGTPGAPTVTADQAVAPVGTTTADRIQVPATTAAQASCMYGVFSQTGNHSGGIFLKGNGTTDTVEFALYDNTAALYRCVTCEYNPTTWTRCLKENVGQGSVAGTIILGNLGSGGTLCNTGAHGAKDFFAWGAQAEVGAFASSYIKTEGSAVARAAESASFNLGNRSAGTMSLAATALFPIASGATNPLPVLVRSSATNFLTMYHNATKLTANVRWGSDNVITSTGVITAGAATRCAAFGDGVSKGVCLNGTCETAAAAVTAASASYTLWIGSAAAASDWFDGVAKRVCYDDLPGRCR
jgi:hypothetical protein